MRHLYANFLKKYCGPIFTDHLYPDARSYTENGFRYHMHEIFNTPPEAIEWLEKNHSKLWYRSGFGEKSKCDYLTNNVSESLNNQIKGSKGLLLHELLDTLRVMVMQKMALRRDVGRQFKEGEILPNVMKELNAASQNLRVVKVARGDADFAEVTLMCADNIARRHTMDLKNHTCSCRRWQLTGKPCWHALAWIRSNRGVKIEDFVHPYYSVNKFKAAYAGIVPSLTYRTQWPVCGPGIHCVFSQAEERTWEA